MNDMTAGATAPQIPQTVTIAQPKTTEAEVTTLVQMAEGFVIDSDDTMQIAADECRAIADKLKAVEEERVKITKPLHDAKKATDTFFKKLSDPLDRAKRILSQKVIAFQQEQERKRREEAAKAEEAARKERERLEREAAALEKKGKTEAAAAKREVATMVPMNIEAAPITKAAGFSTRANWKARCADKAALIRFVAAHPEYEALLDINESKCNALAKTHEAKLSEVVPPLAGYNDAIGAVR